MTLLLVLVLWLLLTVVTAAAFGALFAGGHRDEVSGDRRRYRR